MLNLVPIILSIKQIVHLLTNSLFEIISSAGAAKSDKCSATMKHKIILIEYVRTSKNCSQSPLLPWVRNKTGNNVYLRRSIEILSGSNVAYLVIIP